MKIEKGEIGIIQWHDWKGTLIVLGEECIVTNGDGSKILTIEYHLLGKENESFGNASVEYIKSGFITSAPFTKSPLWRLMNE